VHFTNSLAWLAAIVESSEDAIVSKDLNGIIQTWNSAAQQLYGYTPQEAIGRSMQILLPADLANEEEEILTRIRQGEKVAHFETRRLRKDNSERDVSLTISPVRDEAGRILGASHVARDITEHRQFEQQLRQTQRLESLGVLAGGIAHDFNNLLTGVLGNASLVSEITPSSSPTQQYLREIMSASQRLSDLTRQLMAYAGRGPRNIAPLDLSELVREISSLVQASIPKNVQVRLQLDERLPPVSADASQIQQIIMNLILNGAEAVPEGTTGSVLVTTGSQQVDESYIHTISAAGELRSGRYVYLEVHDTGTGISPETLTHIFDPFFTTKVQGRGLGLAAVLGIIRSHKGAVKVYSQPGKGCTFKVLLPALEDGSKPLPDKQTAELMGAGTILVVDDEEVIRRIAKATLELYGYNVILANNGADALRMFEQRADEINLVLLDLVMPVMGGEETYRSLRIRRPDIPVVLSSGYSDEAARERFAGKGLSNFINKPYTARALAEIVRRALE
jgi:PAS domain S-box-containing protein